MRTDRHYETDSFINFANTCKNGTWYMVKRTWPHFMHEPVGIGGCNRGCFVTEEKENAQGEGRALIIVFCYCFNHFSAPTFLLYIIFPLCWTVLRATGWPNTLVAVLPALYHAPISPLSSLLCCNNVGRRYLQNTCTYLPKHMMLYHILMTQWYENLKPFALL
jgi:hypothetical protein